jgi:Domain of unknown function (DUF389)
VVLSDMLHGGGVTTHEVARVRDVVVFEPPDLKRKLIRFWILLTLATAIGMSLLVGAGGIVTAIAVGWLLSQVLTSSFDPEQVGQIMARTSPNLIDMPAALATGLAGAFAIGRKDVSDTLPGVAIAISLVPPLAIVLTGALVFGLMGYPQAAFVGKSLRSKRVALALVVLMFVVILMPLGLESYGTWIDRTAAGTAAAATETWLQGSGYSVVSVTVDDAHSAVDVVIAGLGTIPPEADLQKALAGKVFGLDVRVEAVPTTRFQLTTK